MDKMHFTFSDTVAGYVTSSDQAKHAFGLRTSDGREFLIHYDDTTYAEVIRNLNEPFQDSGTSLESLFTPGRYLFAYCVAYQEAGDFTFEAKRIIIAGRQPEEYRFDEPDWWVKQISELAKFYFKAQFPNGEINYDNYRTHLTVEGQKIETTCQETDTISRMIYG